MVKISGVDEAAVGPTHPITWLFSPSLDKWALIFGCMTDYTVLGAMYNGLMKSRVDVFQQEAEEKYLSMLYQAIRFPKKLEQPLLLGGRKGVPDYCGLAHKCSEGWDASREYVFPRGCDDTEHTSHLNPETTRSTTLLSTVEPQILPGRRG
nr:hypothetical protein [Tanacetum cinerariifolium]